MAVKYNSICRSHSCKPKNRYLHAARQPRQPVLYYSRRRRGSVAASYGTVGRSTWVANYDISISISQGEKWRTRLALWRIQFCGGIFLRGSGAREIVCKQNRCGTLGDLERERELLSWLLEVMNDPLCNRRNRAGMGRGCRRRDVFDTRILERSRECITNVLYSLRGTLHPVSRWKIH